MNALETFEGKVVAVLEKIKNDQGNVSLDGKGQEIIQAINQYATENGENTTKINGRCFQEQDPVATAVQQSLLDRLDVLLSA